MVVFDVTRSFEDQFDYYVLECIKNSYIVLGTYGGECMRFAPMKVIVFANFYPIISKLARWDIHGMGKGVLADISRESVVHPRESCPPVPPPANCDLPADFDLHFYLVRE